MQQSHSIENGFTSTKNDKPRDVPLTWDAVEALETQRRRVRGDLVFPRDEDGGVLTRNGVNWVLDKLSKCIGMRHIHSHVLRHTFASHLVMRGAPLKAVQELLGHATIQMTMRYAHLAPEVKRDAVQFLDRAPCIQNAPTVHFGA